MSDSSHRLEDYLLRWEELRLEGKVTAPEDICTDPRLLPQFKHEIARLAKTEALLDMRRGVHGVALPETIGKYRIIGLIGSAGQGDVFRAVHPTLEKELVIKRLRGGRLVTAAQRTRLIDEGRILAQLEHPYLARIYDLDFDHGRPFLVMEFVRGPNLRQYVSQHPLSPREIAVLMDRIARAVAVVHQRGVIHLDLKPENIVVDERGEPRVIDFGIAQLKDAWRDEFDEIPSTGGTPAYMAPEQARRCMGEDVPLDYRTDVFGLGAVLYWLLTGNPPFAAPKPQEVIDRAIHCAIDWNVLASADRHLASVCRRALQSEPDQRFPSALALAEALEQRVRPKSTKWTLASLSVGNLGCALTLGSLLLAVWIGSQRGAREEARDKAAGGFDEYKSKADPISLLSMDLLSRRANVVRAGSEWQFFDQGGGLSTRWTAEAEKDSIWSVGKAPFGYGHRVVATVVSYGENKNKKHITTFFRRKIRIENRDNIDDFLLGLVCDDGAVVYLNGNVIVRYNLPESVNVDTLALRNVEGAEETRWRLFAVDKNTFVTGDNYLAIEVHQQRPDSPDLRFDLFLMSDALSKIIPMLQQTGPGFVDVLRVLPLFGTNEAKIASALVQSSRLPHTATERREILRCLGALRSGDQAAISLLLQGLADNDVTVRRQAHESFVSIGKGNSAVVDAVGELFAASDVNLQLRALRVVAELGAAANASRPAIMPLAAAESPMITAWVKEAIAILDGAARPAIDVLPLVVTGEDAVSGNWQRDRGRLVSAGETTQLLQLPMALPPAYIIEANVEPRGKKGNGLAMGLRAANGERFGVVLDINAPKPTSGLDGIDGTNALENETTVHGAVLADTGVSRVVCTVRRGHITVVCNGTMVCDWKGNESRLSAGESWRTTPSNRALLVTYGSWIFNDVTIKPLPNQ